MKYTFEDSCEMGYFCKFCHNKTILSYDVKISGNNKKSNTIKRVTPHYDSFVVNCGRCGSSMVAIDPLILDPVARLNTLGYITRYCCSGHIRKESIIINMSGQRYKPDGDFSHYPSLYPEDMMNYALKKRQDYSVTKQDVTDLPQEIEFLADPNIIFHQNMPFEKKRKLWDAIHTVMYGEDRDKKFYPQFMPRCAVVDSHGAEINEVLDEPKEEIKNRISIVTKESRATQVNMEYPEDAEKCHKKIIKEFARLLQDIANELFD